MHTTLGADEGAERRSRRRDPDRGDGYARYRAPLVRISLAVLRLRSPEDGAVAGGAGELAGLCGVRPKTAERALRRLEALRAVRCEGGRLLVLNPALLAELVGVE